MIGIRLQVSHWLQKIDNQANAAQVLESLLADCKRWIEVAEKAIKEGTVPASLLPPSNLKEKEKSASPQGADTKDEKEEEPEPTETIWGKRNRILQKAIGISVKLAELYNDEHVLKPDIAHERLIWGVETSLKEMKRRSEEGTKPGEGEWLNSEQIGAAIECELELVIFFSALSSSSPHYSDAWNQHR